MEKNVNKNQETGKYQEKRTGSKKNLESMNRNTWNIRKNADSAHVSFLSFFVR